jgi:cytochrome c biogenesis protein CcmG, thiol:disulfide interchange protein DsbE
MRRRAVLVLLAGALTLAGCEASDSAGERVGPTESSAPTVSGEQDVVAAIDPCPTSGQPTGRGDGLPDLELPCLGPGDPVLLSGLTGRPRLVNVWASWCEPCREEMPWLQRAHDSGVVDVLGVDAEDRATSATALLASLDVTFPSVFDPENQFARQIRVITKPTTVFVSDEGEVVHVLPGAVASYDELRALTREHLGVELP